MKHNKCQRSYESGNALIMVLIAVALFVALSYAFSDGLRSGSGGISREQASIIASEISDFSGALAGAVTRLRNDGVPAAIIRFAHPDLNAAYGTLGTTPDYEIFHQDGGGLNYKPPPAGANDGSDWEFIGTNDIPNLGRSGCAAANETCTELIALLPNVDVNVCNVLNERMDINTTAPPQDAGQADIGTRFAGSFARTQTIADAAGVLNGKLAGCFEGNQDDSSADISGNYYFFQVLLAR